MECVCGRVVRGFGLEYIIILFVQFAGYIIVYVILNTPLAPPPDKYISRRTNTHK